MTKNEITIGGTYVAKVSGRLVEVRIDREYPRGGWEGTSLSTNKTIRIKSSQRLRAAAKEKGQAANEPQAVPAESAPQAQGGGADAADDVQAGPAGGAAGEERVPLTQAMAGKKKGSRAGKNRAGKKATAGRGPKGGDSFRFSHAPPLPRPRSGSGRRCASCPPSPA